MKKLLAVVMAAVMVLSLAACGGAAATTDAAPAATEAAKEEAKAEAAAEAVTEAAAEAASAGKEGPYKVALMLYSSEDEATDVIKEGVISAAEAAGVELIIGDNAGDATKTAALLQNMLLQEPDAIIDATWDQSVGLSTSAQCKEAGIPLFTCDVEYDEYAHLIGANNYTSGRKNGEYVAEWVAANWDGQVEDVLALCEMAGGEGVRSRCQGSLDVLDEKGMLPSEDHITWQDGKGLTDPSKTLTIDYLTAHPDSHKIFIIPNNDGSALGAYNAALTMGREDDVCICSFNADSYAVEHFATTEEDSWKGTVNFNLGGYGDIAIPAIVEILSTGVDNFDHELNTETFVIDRSNAKDYYTE